MEMHPHDKYKELKDQTDQDVHKSSDNPSIVKSVIKISCLHS